MNTNNTWDQETHLSSHHSARGPDLITYRDPNVTIDQLLHVFRGID
ncbi:hypothetical protein [Streptomyces sp. NPDC012825]